MKPDGGLEAVVQLGREEARAHNGGHLLPHSLWCAVCRVEDPMIDRVFTEVRVDRKQMRRWLRALGAEKARVLSEVPGKDVRIADDSFRLLRQARKRAEAVGQANPSPFDLLVALAEDNDAEVNEVLRHLGSSLAALLEVCSRIDAKPRPAANSTTPLLDALGKDYCALARQKKIGPVVGRRTEILEVLRVLSRKEKNNPVLIGEPGVGKTAVVEGLALRAIEPTAPPPLKDKRIVEIALSALVAGTRYRGDFEERVQKLMAEVQRNEDVILFFDEMHMMVGAGGSGDAMDVANLLKPALARGQFRLIGATTPAEYRRYIESDAALERRFQPVRVEEPTPAETLEILRGLQPGYEAHHGVTYQPEALQAAIDLTVRYVPDRRLPDKARDVLDQAAAQVRIRSLTFRAADGPTVIGPQEVAAAVAAWKGIPIEQVHADERQRLQGLGDRLRQRVKGQDHVIDPVAQAVQVARLGLANPQRPHAVFLFAGPTGVGKTELARALAEQLFGNEKALVRFDMSEYMEAHTVSRLVGSPPGYVGHKEGAQLVDAVRTKPFCLVLLDEVEKAHPQVLNLFLQVFDDGRLTDTSGRTADFRNTLIIMTSNLGAAEAMDEDRGIFGLEQRKETFSRLQECVDLAVRRHFAPEFLGRLTAIHLFRPLDRGAVRQVVMKYVGRLQAQLQTHRVRLDLADDVYDLLVEKGFSPELGARPVEQAVDQLLRAPIARLLLNRVGTDQERTLSVLRAGDELQLVWDDSVSATR